MSRSTRSQEFNKPRLPDEPESQSDSTRQPSKLVLNSPHLSIAELATYLGVSAHSVRRKMRNGDVPFHERSGFRPYFLKSEIDAWLGDANTLRPVRSRPRQVEECVHDQEKVERILARAKPPRPDPNDH